MKSVAHHLLHAVLAELIDKAARDRGLLQHIDGFVEVELTRGP
jgi:hypothetical protein